MTHTDRLLRSAPLLAMATSLSSCTGLASSAKDDLFVGTFMSETRENFGPGQLGEIEVRVVRKDDKYVISVVHKKEFKFDIEAVPCSPDKEGYFKARPPGDAYALCNISYGSSVFVYSQNGIKDPMVDIYNTKGLKNPRTDMYYRTQYYGHIQWSFWGFRKMS